MIEEELARAFLDAATKENYFIYTGQHRGDSLSEMMIDGKVDLLAGVRAILTRLREPTPEMVEAGMNARDMERSPKAILQAMLDAISPPSLDSGEGPAMPKQRTGPYDLSRLDVRNRCGSPSRIANRGESGKERGCFAG